MHFDPYPGHGAKRRLSTFDPKFERSPLIRVYETLHERLARNLLGKRHVDIIAAVLHEIPQDEVIDQDAAVEAKLQGTSATVKRRRSNVIFTGQGHSQRNEVVFLAPW